MISRVTIEVRTPNEKPWGKFTPEQQRDVLMTDITDFLFMAGLKLKVIDGPYTD